MFGLWAYFLSALHHKLAVAQGKGKGCWASQVALSQGCGVGGLGGAAVNGPFRPKKLGIYSGVNILQIAGAGRVHSNFKISVEFLKNISLITHLGRNSYTESYTFLTISNDH